MAKKVLVTNTAAGAIRVGSVVVAVGKSERVDGGELKKLRAKDASPAAKAHGEALVDGAPELGGKPLVDGKVVEDAEAEAEKIMEATRTLANAEGEKIIKDAITKAEADAKAITDKARADAKTPTPPKPPAGK